jgi:hypothetical protein
LGDESRSDADNIEGNIEAGLSRAVRLTLDDIHGGFLI